MGQPSETGRIRSEIRGEALVIPHYFYKETRACATEIVMQVRLVYYAQGNGRSSAALYGI